MNVTIKDIAKRANVSYATVSRALNNKYGVKPATHEKIVKIAKELHYNPNSIAQGLVKNRTYTVGLILPDITNPYFPEVAHGVENHLSANGYSVFLCNTDWDPHRERRFVTLLSRRRTDGLIISPASGKIDELEKTVGKEIPLVYVSNAPKKTEHFSVVIDNVRGGYLATEHLITCGYETIGFIGVAEGSMMDDDRLEGYMLAMKQYDREVIDRFIHLGSFRGSSAYEAVSRMIANKDFPRAFFVQNDVLAVSALHAVKDAGLTVPDTIAIVGFDDISYASFREIQLTTIRQPQKAMGRIAARLLLGQMEGARKAPTRNIVLEPELVVRKTSCG